MNFNKRVALRNPHQGDTKKVLCVCSAGLLRSPTMAIVLHNEFGYNTRSAGCYGDFALIPVSEELLDWADEVVVAEKSHSEYLRDFFDYAEAIVLDVPDQFEWNNEELRKIIKEKYVQKREDTEAGE